MAVYTSVNRFELEDFLEQFNLGKLIFYDGILVGIENSNYIIIMHSTCGENFEPGLAPMVMNLLGKH